MLIFKANFHGIECNNNGGVTLIFFLLATINHNKPFKIIKKILKTITLNKKIKIIKI